MTTTCDDHTKSPDGYLQWHEWAERKSTTHTQVACGECFRYAIWIQRENPLPGPAHVFNPDAQDLMAALEHSMTEAKSSPKQTNREKTPNE